MWLGYIEEFPDYMTQGETLEELQANLKDIYDDITGGEIPGVNCQERTRESLLSSLRTTLSEALERKEMTPCRA